MTKFFSLSGRSPAAMALIFLMTALVASLCACSRGGGLAELRRATVPDAVESPQPRLDMQWRAPVVGYEPFVYRPLQYSQPQVSPDGEAVVVGTNEGEVVSLSTLDGKVNWRAELGGRVDAQPVFYEDLVIAGNDDGVLTALAAGSGEKRWSYETRAEIDGAATVSQGRVFFMNTSDELYTLDVRTGKYLWSYGREMPDYFTLGNATRPAIYEDSVIVGFADGFLVALQMDSGEELWEADLRSGEDDFTDVDGQPAVAGDWVYAASHAGGLFGLDARTGARRWKLKVTGASSAIVRGGALYTTTAGRYVMAVDRLTGQVFWQYRHRENTPSSPSTAAGYLFYGGSDGGFYITESASGYPLLQFDPDAGFNAPITLHGAMTAQGNHRMMAYAFSNGGYLYCFEVVAR